MPTAVAPPCADELAFVRAVCERPEDLLPRLVFADWLDERGRHDRAELLRSPGLPPHLADAAERLLPRGFRKARPKVAFTFNHGFAERVTCSPRFWGDYGPGVVGRQPIRGVLFHYKQPAAWTDGGTDWRRGGKDRWSRFLPGWLFDELTGGEPLPGDPRCRRYPNSAAAVSDASAAAVRWARRAAGLSEWEPPPVAA